MVVVKKVDMTNPNVAANVELTKAVDIGRKQPVVLRNCYYPNQVVSADLVREKKKTAEERLGVDNG